MMSPSQHFGNAFPHFSPYDQSYSSYCQFRNPVNGPGSTGSSNFGPSSSPSSNSSSSPDTVRGTGAEGPGSGTRWPASYTSGIAPNTIAPSPGSSSLGVPLHHPDSRLNPLDSSRLAAGPSAPGSYGGAAGGVGRGATPGASPHPSTMNSHSQQSHRPAFRIPDGTGGVGTVPVGAVGSTGGMGAWHHHHQHLQGMQDSFNGHSSIQHFQGHYNPGSNLSDGGLPIPLGQLGLDEQDLVTTQTRELNKNLKAKGFSKDVIKEIKARRRTMKNRDYAKQGRINREHQITKLQADLNIREESIKQKKEIIETHEQTISLIRLNKDALSVWLERTRPS